ncbi:L,D-transpeptidase [Paenibacillus hodogayensis]|uniref:L,D-transpeptidase n=1 Tax=Paenibacillus hodogayensis TaxID=279208 RepID=A0ABV5W878_9BACL
MEVCGIERARQMLVVEAPDYVSVRAKLSWWELGEGAADWRRIGAASAAIGRNGLSPLKREGDGRTPAGRFLMGTGFGALPVPPGRWPYRLADAHDYWVDDPGSPDYNTWVRYTGDPAGLWQSFERLAITPYRKAAVIRFNEAPIVRGRGSAIFFHVWSGPDSGSAGCVTAAEQDVLRVLEWLRPEAEPAMAVGTRQELLRLAPFAL